MPRHDRAYGQYSSKKQKAGNKRRVPVRERAKGKRGVGGAAQE